MGKLDYDRFVEMKEQQPASAIHFYNRIIRHRSYELVYEKKNNPVYFADRMERQMKGMGLKDSQLLIDLRLGS